MKKELTMSDTSPKDAELAELIAFLNGDAMLDGVWFGEDHPTLKGKFWWRKRLGALSQVRKQALLEAAEICDQFDACDPKYIKEAIRKLAEEE
jgi:hypothetical protein